MTASLVISARDNVATALEPFEAGRVVRAGDSTIAVTEPIPRGHKFALRMIRAGEPIVKYGSPIGTASVDIEAGRHVHTHNVASARGRGDLAGHGDGSRSTSEPRSVPASARLAEPPDADDLEDARVP